MVSRAGFMEVSVEVGPGSRREALGVIRGDEPVLRKYGAGTAFGLGRR